MQERHRLRTVSKAIGRRILNRRDLEALPDWQALPSEERQVTVQRPSTRLKPEST